MIGKLPPAKARCRKRQPEQAFQKSLVKTLAMVMERGTFMFAVPNGGYRSKTEAAIFAGLGVVPGMTDLVFFHNGRALCMELKAGRGRVSDNQTSAIERIERAGVPVAIIRTLPEALNVLRAHGFPLRIKDPAHPVHDNSSADAAGGGSLRPDGRSSPGGARIGGNP